jgi:L-amino acid N-acyltransferase YncA
MICKFEEVRASHLNSLLNIYNYYIKNSTSTFHEKELTADEMRNLLFFNDNRHKAFSIFIGDQIVGYVLIAKHKQREAYDATGEIAIYIHKDYVHRGIGREALKFIENYAKSKDYHALIATICAENFESIKLFETGDYSKCAHFREVGKKFGKLLDVVSYQKIL